MPHLLVKSRRLLREPASSPASARFAASTLRPAALEKILNRLHLGRISPAKGCEKERGC